MNKSEISNIKHDLLLDTCGLRCPQPIIYTKKSIGNLTKNQILLIIASDPSFQVDCVVFVRQTGHILLQSWQEGEKFYFVLQRNT